MRKYTIVCDGNSNLSLEDRNKYGIKMVCAKFELDGKLYEASPDYKDMSVKEFYDQIRNGKRITTSKVNPSEFEELFEKIVNDGEDVLYIACAEKLSASYSSSLIAKDNILKNHPDANIECVNSHNATYALGMMILDAAKRRDDGMSLIDNVNWIKAHDQEYNQIGTVGELVYLKRAGRVSAPSAFFGGLLGIKPIIVSDKEGGNAAVEKMKGKKKAFLHMAEVVKQYINTKDHKIVYMNHADCIEDATEFANLILEKVNDPELKVEYHIIEPAIGASVGPGTLIFNFYASSKLREDFNK